MRFIYTPELIITSLIENANSNKIEFRHILKKDDETRNRMICENHVVIENICIDEIFFDSIDFSEGISLRNCKIKKINFLDCNFKPNVDNHSFSTFNLNIGTLNFTDCSFEGDVMISTLDGVVKDIEFQSCQIYTNVRFDKINLAHDGRISIGSESVYVKGNCEFFRCTIVKGTIDIRADIYGELRFYLINKAYSDENRHLNNPFNSNIDFHAANIKKIRFYESNIHSVSMHNTAVDDIYQQNTIIDKFHPEALKIFRDAAIRNNDDVLALKYTGDLYNAMLKDESIRHLRAMVNKLDLDHPVTKKTKIKLSQILLKMVEPFVLFFSSLGSGERLMLWLNKYSNDFNRNWFRGIVFTLSVALVFYFLLNYCGMESPHFVVDFRWDGFSDVLLGYISILDIFGWSNSKDILKLTSSGEVIMFFAKLFVSYGIWQTVYAFYKYRK